MEVRERLTHTEQFDRSKRDYDDLTTLFAEMAEGSMRTPFEYVPKDGELYARDGTALRTVFEDSLDAAKRAAERDPSLAFEVRRRHWEMDEYHDMLAMVRGEADNTMVITSDFPPELMGALQDVGGYNVTRKQAMLRVLVWDGKKLKMYSQSLDLSDREALEDIHRSVGFTPRPGELLAQRRHLQLHASEQEQLISKLTGVYDRSLHDRLGGNWYAGRQDDSRINTYDFVCAQHDIIQYAMLQKRLGRLNLYQVAALIDERLRANKRLAPTEVIVCHGTPFRDMRREMLEASWKAQAIGKVFSACGVSVEASDGMAARDELAAAGYGNKAFILEDKHGSRTFDCPKCHRENVREIAGKLEPRCKKCGADVSCDPKRFRQEKRKLFDLKKAPPKVVQYAGKAALTKGKTRQVTKTKG